MAYDASRSRVVLYGGNDAGQFFEDTWEFDGSRWMQGPGGPAGLGKRAYHAITYDATRRRTVLFGGGNPQGGLMNDTWEYDGTAWTPGAQAPAALEVRYYAAMAFDGRRSRVVLFGGFDALFWEVADTWEYDGSVWTAGPDCPEARGDHAMAFDAARGLIVMAGGYNGGYPADDVWEYDGIAWTPGVAPPTPYRGRMGPAMTFHASANAVLVTAGSHGAGYLRDAWLYDGASWAQVADLPGDRGWHGLAYDAGNDRSVSFGGARAQGETLLFDGTSWTVGPSGMPPRRDHAMAYDRSRRRVVTCTGRDGLGAWVQETWELGASAWTRAATSGPTPRFGARMAYDASRARTVLFGGDGYFSDTWEYDGSAWTQIAVASPDSRGWQGHAMAYDPGRQRVVIFGGKDRTTNPPSYSNETWEYDGTSWTPGGAAPLWPRENAAMAHVPARSCLVLFGGVNRNTVLDDTWEYDGNWRYGATAPPGLLPRHRAAMATDEGRGVAVLFGGELYSGGGNAVDDTWEYGAAGWVQGAAPPPSMTSRIRMAMAYSGPLAGIVLLGGQDPSTTLALDDTWIYTDPVPPPLSPDVVTGQGLGLPNPNRVRVFTAQGTATPVDFLAYAAGAWGTNVAAAGIDGSAEDEMLTGPGPGSVYGPQVRAFLSDGSSVAKVNFYAYGTLRYGANVGATPLDGDAYAELLSAPGPGTVFGPHVRGFDYDGLAVAAIAKVSFFAFGTLQYGANVAGGDVDADLYGELLAGPGPGPSFTAQARGFDYDGASLAPIAKINFAPFALGYGLALSAGDLDGDGYAELSTTPGPGPANPARILGFDYDGVSVAALPGADVTPFATGYGAATAVDALLPDTAGRDELVAGAGRDPAASSSVLPYRYLSGLVRVGTTFVPFPGGYGVNVALGRLAY